MSVPNYTKLQQRLTRGPAAARQAMSAFRANRKTMGFVQTSAYIPESRRSEHSLFVRKLQAEYFMSLLNRPFDDPAKIGLAQCNYAALPDTETVREALQLVEAPAVKAVCKEVLANMEQFSVARAGLQLIQHSEEEVVNFAARAVAYNAMAAYLWDYAASLLTEAPIEVEPENA